MRELRQKSSHVSTVTHLTFDDLTAFAALSQLDDGSTAFAAEVCKHLRECRHCRDLAAAVLQISEALESEMPAEVKTEIYRKNTMYR